MSSALLYDDQDLREDAGTIVVVVDNNINNNNKTTPTNIMPQSDCLSSPISTTCSGDCWDLPVIFDGDDFFQLPPASEEAGDAESGVFIASSPTHTQNCCHHHGTINEDDVDCCQCCEEGIPIAHEPVFITTSDTSTVAFAPCGSCPRRTLSCGSKKNVRFADIVGMPLTHIVTFANSPVGSDSIHNTPIPATPLARLLNMVKTQPQSVSLFQQNNCMELLFPDPLTSYSVLADKLQSQNVALESVCCRSGFIKGMIRVKNLSYSKNVFVRITFDAWSSFHDWACDIFPIVASLDGANYDYDLFEFAIPIPPHLMPGTVVQFCLCFRCQEGEFWDNNFGQNFSLRYRPQTASKMATNTSTLASIKAAENEAERAQRIRHFVMSEFASINNISGSSELVVPALSHVKHRVVTSVANHASPNNAMPKTTQPPAPNCVDTPYW